MSASTRTRAALSHPVIDADAHLLEFEPAYHAYVKAEGGDAALNACRASSRAMSEWYEADAVRRRRERIQRPAFALPTRNTVDLATTMFPRLLYRRLDAMGIDFMVVNPTLAF